MKSFLKTAVCLTLVFSSSIGLANGAQEAGRATVGFNDLIQPAYIYAEAARREINWMYIGMVPRMEDPQRVKVVMSKAGLTMRISLEMTPEEVADYPSFLSRRYRQMKDIISAENLSIPQQYRFDQFESQILAIENELRLTPGDVQSQYTYGFQLLKRHFPANVFEIVANGSVTRVEAHFVYPITIHSSVTWPRPDTYRPYIVEERRSYYSKAPGLHIFGGFPAIWLDPTGAGTGVHGPIRFSNASEGRRDKGEGRMRNFWAENNFLGEETPPTTDLEPTYRWDLVRRPNSHGCFRAETLEPRHLLPSDNQRIIDDNKEFRNLGKGPGRNTKEIDYDSVTFQIIAEFDRISVEGHLQNAIVNVAYYVVDPYQKPNPARWLKDNLLTSKERKREDADTILQTKMSTEIYTFPYLDPNALEYYTPNKGASLRTMTLLNQAH